MEAALSNSRARAEFDAWVALSSKMLGPDEWFVVGHETDGPLFDTKAKDFATPVRIFCEALNVDWEDAKDDGWSLQKVTLP
jgi:hypothetical protein